MTLGRLALTVFIFCACEEDAGQLSINPENNLGVFFVDQPLGDQVSQLWAGSAPGSFAGVAAAGISHHPALGTAEASTFCDISMLRVTYDTATVFTAAVTNLTLNMRIIGAVGSFSPGDIQQFSLYQLARPVENTTELNSATLQDLGEKVGEATLALYADSIDLKLEGSVDSSRYDNTGTYEYLLHFELTEGYKAAFLEGFISAVEAGVSRGENDVDSVSYFLDQNLKGLAIIAEEKNNAILSFNLLDIDNTNFNLTYTITNTSGTADGREADFFFNSLKSFNYITPNENTPWSGGLFDGLTDVNDLTGLAGDSVYFQRGSNLLMAIDMSGFRDLRDTIPNAIVQKATLFLNNVRSFDPVFPLPAALAVNISNVGDIAEGILSNSADNNVLSDLPGTMAYFPDSNRYVIEPTLYLQGTIDSSIPYDHIIIGSKSDFTFGSFAINKDDIVLRYYYTVNE